MVGNMKKRGEKEKVEHCSAENSEKRKKSPVVAAKQALNMEEQLLKVSSAINANVSKLNQQLLEGETGAGENHSDILQAIKESLRLVNDCVKVMSEVTPIVGELVQTLNVLLKAENIDMQIQLGVIDILLNITSSRIIQLPPQDQATMIFVLLENCIHNHGDKHMVSFNKKLKKLLLSVQSNESLKSSCLEGKSRILSSGRYVLNNISLYLTETGREIISNILALCNELVKEFHEQNLRYLVNCKKSEASAVGKIYYRTWELMSSSSSSNDNDKRYLEEECLQWLMERAFTLGRQEAFVRNLSLNLQSLLSSLHSSRKQAKFSKLITTLYAPLMWKYLNSHNNIHRCNAAEIFMDVYPLEKPNEGKKVYSQFLRKQHEEMLSLLNDPCPAVRVIAIKGVCLNMKYYWITFQNGTVEEVVKKFVNDLVVDGSSAEVRKAVYQGFTQLLDCKESHALLKGVLPTLGGFVHDENQGVRSAFIKMLIKVKNVQSDDIKYWHIINLHAAAFRLENDSSSNRELMVKLIFSSFHNHKITTEEMYKRLCKFISYNPTASRYLARYSQNTLKFEKAVELMYEILSIIHKHIEKRMNSGGNENNDASSRDDTNKETKLRRADAAVLASIENLSESDENAEGGDNSSVESMSNSSSSRKSVSISDPFIAHGLFDFVSMLWLVHGKKLLEEANKPSLEKLYSISIKCVGSALRYFKGTHAFFGVLYLAGMIPFSKLQYTTTVFSTCLSMLRQMPNESESYQYHCIVHVLCVWNRGEEILELVREWLDEAFRTECLNESTFNRPAYKRSRRVKFARTEAKPLLALNILDELFASPTDQQCIFLKNSPQLHEFLQYLSRIQTLVEKRINKASELSTLLNDDFLQKCLVLYGNLMIMFKENKVENYKFWQEFAHYLDWCDRIFGKGRKEAEEEDNVVPKLLQVSLMQCCNVLALGKCNDEQLLLLSTYYLSALNSERGMYCVEMAVNYSRQLVKFSRVHHTDRNNEIINIWFPRLLDKILSLLAEKIYTKSELSPFIKSIVILRKNLVFIYLLTMKMYPNVEHCSNLSYKIMCTFCTHLINILLLPIKDCETLNVDQSIKNLPFTGSLLAAVLISQAELASAFLTVLKTIISGFTNADALQLLSTASLLYTLSFTPSKIKKKEILKAVKVTFDKLENITTEEGSLALVMNSEKTIGDRTIIDIEDTTKLAVKEIGKHILKLITEQLGGSLL